jgi:hypothetical protein
MKFQFTATSRITMVHTKGEATSQHESTEILLSVSNNLDPRKYLDRGVPRKEGVKPLTIALTHGLIANIHAAHERGFWDSAEHLRFIINELETGFSRVADVTEDDYKEGGGS